MTRQRVRGSSGALVGACVAAALVLLAVGLVTREHDGSNEGSRSNAYASPIANPAMLPRLMEPVPVPEPLDLATAPDIVPRVGRRVRLGPTTVQSVPGDGVLWVGPGLSTRLLVVLRDDAAGRTGDGPRIEPGQMVSAIGTLWRIPTTIGPWRARYGLQPGAEAAIRSANVYLAADSVTIQR